MQEKFNPVTRVQQWLLIVFSQQETVDENHSCLLLNLLLFFFNPSASVNFNFFKLFRMCVFLSTSDGIKNLEVAVAGFSSQY